MTHVVVIITGLISATSVWVGNHISNKPKSVDASQNRVEWIVERTTAMYEECMKKANELAVENRELRRKISELRKKITELEKRLNDTDKRG